MLSCLQYSLQEPIYCVKAARLIPPLDNKPFRFSTNGTHGTLRSYLLLLVMRTLTMKPMY